MGRDLPDGQVTFLFTDVEGSTRLLHELGANDYAAALAEHRRVIRAVCADAGGVEVDTQGDAFFWAFPTAPGAASAATGMTDALQSGPIRVRVGLHTGVPLLTDEGYVGDDVHFAARVAATGHGGQVVVSSATADLIPGLELHELGEHRLKDIEGAVALFQLGHGAFPPLKSISNTNLPRPASSFLGRERELAALLDIVKGGARLITLTGPGGTGKTRLAIEAAASLVGSYKAGVFWVGLSGVRDSALLADTIAQTIGAREGLIEHLANREMLLLLDNFEQVVDAAPELSALLEACPNLTMLVTSRELLRIKGEVEYAVPPLDSSEAVALFCARSGLAPTDEIADLCRRLDSLPLAVELAAARTAALTPAMIIERLSRRLDLLKAGRDADPRQQTLRATIEWSYDLLLPDERALFSRLAIFAGGWTLEAAEAVAEADIDTLQSLVEKSLVRFANGRYQMLATIREFASELDPAKEIGLLRRHAEFYCDLAVGLEKELRGPREAESLDGLAIEQDNLRAALQWAADHDRGLLIRLTIALGRFWWVRGTNAEARRWYELAVEEPDLVPRDLLASVLADLAFRAIEVKDWETTYARGTLALEIARELGLHEIAFRAITPITEALAHDGRWAEADVLTEESIEHARASSNPYLIAAAVYNFGETMRERGDLPKARSLMEEALTLAEAAGIQEAIASSRIGLGAVIRAQGSLDEALAMLRQAVAGQMTVGFKARISWGLIEIAGILLEQEDPRTAAKLLGAAAAIGDGTDWTEESDPIEARLESLLGTDELRLLKAEGERLSAEEAATLAGVVVPTGSS